MVLTLFGDVVFGWEIEDQIEIKRFGSCEK